MNTDFTTAMRRALEHTRAQDLVRATEVIQMALRQSSDQEGHGDRSLIEPKADMATEPRTSEVSQTAVQPASITDILRASLRPRRPLHHVVDAVGAARSLNAGRARRAARSVFATPETPTGARFLARSFSCPAGTRNYKLYVPADLDTSPRGLVVMLHGCSQNPDDFAIGTGMNAIAEKHGLLVAYPSQKGSDNAAGCWNWFRPGDQLRDLGEPAIIAGITRALVAEFGLNGGRVFVAGLSAGGAMAAVMGGTYAELFAAIGIHSGLPHGAANDMISAFAAMRGEGTAPQMAPAAPAVRTIVFHGSADQTVHPSNADLIAADARARLERSRVEHELGQSKGGRAYSRTITFSPDQTPAVEQWLIDGAGHAWAGGQPSGSHTDPDGPDASAEMIRFFLAAA